MPDIEDIALKTNPAGLAVSGGLGIVEAGIGLLNAGKLKREAEQLERTRPKRKISPLIGQNLALTESELASGLSPAAETAYTNMMNQEQAGSLSAILRGGGDVNTVSELYGAGETGRSRLALISDQLRLNKIQNVLRARDVMADEEDKNFLFNQFAPWADKAQATGQQRQNANKQIWSGLSTATGGFSELLGGGGNREFTPKSTNAASYLTPVEESMGGTYQPNTTPTINPNILTYR